MSSRIKVLIPDGDSTWALSVIQCLSQVEGYDIYVLSNKKRTPAKFSRYTSYYKFYERTDDAQWLSIIISEIETNAIDVVVPIAEKEVTFFIKHRDNIQSSSLISLPSLAHYQIAINKKKLSDFSKQHDIPHPKSFYFTSQDDIQELLSQVNFPLLIKPLDQKGGDGIEKIVTKDQFPKHSKAPLFIQNYIEGYDVDCSVLCLNGSILTYTIQKGNLNGDTAYAPQLGFDFIENKEVLKVTQDVMSKLNWSGLAHLDLRYDAHAKDYKLIEINGRFWGSVEASSKAGINFPDLSIQLALGNQIEHQGFDPIHYMRLKGVLKTIKRNPLFIFKRKFLMYNTEAKIFLKDPLPTFYKFREWLGRRF